MYTAYNALQQVQSLLLQPSLVWLLGVPPHVDSALLFLLLLPYPVMS
jgi:hypothetical protein